MLSYFRQRTMTFVAETGKLRVERKALCLLCRNRKRWGTAVTNFNVTVITLEIGNTTINVAREICTAIDIDARNALKQLL